MSVNFVIKLKLYYVYKNDFFSRTDTVGDARWIGTHVNKTIVFLQLFIHNKHKQCAN